MVPRIGRQGSEHTREHKRSSLIDTHAQHSFHPDRITKLKRPTGQAEDRAYRVLAADQGGAVDVLEAAAAPYTG
jgi:hypothetical protein